jgi:ATP-dependent protease Clp ATPase subunit
MSEAIRCSFCHREQAEPVRLIQAGEVAICNYCVAFAHDAFEAEGALPVEGIDPAFDDPLAVSTETRLKPDPEP